ncbi:hypothetical protein DW889_07175 [Bacteroides stercoris]|jgi:hypothetical protein|uniref:Uncharacterized protein n=1 Tax=Bacteroides stercoris TaxID=46506 RepID=A0A413V8U5_BACSE|nr:hypothetical protein DW889_07175 [Bacteroides stercoris]
MIFFHIIKIRLSYIFLNISYKDMNIDKKTSSVIVQIEYIFVHKSSVLGAKRGIMLQMRY